MELKEKEPHEIIDSIDQIEDHTRLNNLLSFFTETEKSIKKEVYATTFLMILAMTYLFAIQDDPSQLKLNLIILSLNKGPYADSVAIVLLGFLNFRYTMIAKNRSRIQNLITVIMHKLYPELGKASYRRYFAPFIPINEIRVEQNRGCLYVLGMLVLILPLLVILIIPVVVQIIFTIRYVAYSEVYEFPLLHAHLLATYFLFLVVNGSIGLIKTNSLIKE